MSGAMVIATAVILLAEVLFAHLPEQKALRGQLTEDVRSDSVIDPTERDVMAAVVPESLEKASNAFLAKLMRAVDQSSVELADIDLQTLTGSATELSVRKAEMSGELVGPYPQIKEVLSEVMKAQTAATLDSITLTRRSQGAQVEASVRWSVYYKPGAP